MNKKIITCFGAVSAALVPVTAFAAGRTLSDIISLIIDYLNQFIFLLMALAVVMFVWYIIQYFIKPNEDRKQAGSYVLYSVIGFFVILSIWGIVNILVNTFGLGGSMGGIGGGTGGGGGVIFRFKDLF